MPGDHFTITEARFADTADEIRRWINEQRVELVIRWPMFRPVPPSCQPVTHA